MFHFIYFEIASHPISLTGVIFLIISILCLYGRMYYKLKGYPKKLRKTTIQYLIILHWKLELIILLIFMILSRPLLTYYSDIANWMGAGALFGVFMQIKWHQKEEKRYHLNHKTSWIIKPSIKKGFIGYIKNNLGKYADNIIIKSRLTYQPSSDKSTVRALSSLKVPLGQTILKSSGRGQNIYVMRNTHIYDILNDLHFKHNNDYWLRIVFYQEDNHSSQQFLDFYYRFNDRQNSHSLARMTPGIIYNKFIKYVKDNYME